MSQQQQKIVSIPTNILEKYNRPLIPIQMKLPDGTWSQNIIFNFDTGASWATDVPLQLIDKFGGQVDSDDRKEQPGKIRIVGLEGEFDIPIVRQDKEHYDLFREQVGSRYPLCRVRDLMKYVTIVYKKAETVIRLKSLGLPPELSKPNVIKMPTARRRSGTPTSAWYWNKGYLYNGTRKTEDWFNICTGDRRFILKRSMCDRIGVKRIDDGIDNNGEWNGNVTIVYHEATPDLKLSNIPVTIRNDDERFARGGEPRNLCGGLNFLNKYDIVIYDLNMAFVPI